MDKETMGQNGWKEGSIAVGKTSGMAFVVRGMNEHGQLVLASDGQTANPEWYEHGGEADAATFAAIREGRITEADIQDKLLSSARSGREDEPGSLAAEARDMAAASNELGGTPAPSAGRAAR